MPKVWLEFTNSELEALNPYVKIYVIGHKGKLGSTKRIRKKWYKWGFSKVINKLLLEYMDRGKNGNF